MLKCWNVTFENCLEFELLGKGTETGGPKGWKFHHRIAWCLEMLECLRGLGPNIKKIENIAWKFAKYFLNYLEAYVTFGKIFFNVGKKCFWNKFVGCLECLRYVTKNVEIGKISQKLKIGGFWTRTIFCNITKNVEMLRLKIAQNCQLKKICWSLWSLRLKIA